MAKIHLRRNKSLDTPTIAACASNPYVAKARRNGRASYQFMDSEIVSLAEFKAADPAARCAHCCEAALIIRNRQRTEKGRPPVATWDEKGA